MRVVSIGDLVVDYYYKDNKLLGINGGMTSHNIIANLAKLKHDTKVFGVCGCDQAGIIAIKSLKDLGVDTKDIQILEDINTRVFHVSYITKEDESISFSSKQRCPFCNQKRWYEESKIDTKKIIDLIDEEDILVFDNLCDKNQYIIDNTTNKKVIDLGQYFELEKLTIEDIIQKLNNKFDIINLNERVEKYLLKRFNVNNLLDIYNLFNPKLIIVTRGKKGADFVYNDNYFHYDLLNISQEIDSTGAGDAFFSVFISEYIKSNYIIDNKLIEKTFIKATKLTSRVVTKMGARGHINNLYKIKNKKEVCTCIDFDLQTRKQIKRCNININNLKTRVINAVLSDASEKIININFNNLNNCLFVGTGGSYAVSVFASKVVNYLYGVNCIAIYPRDLAYRNNKKIDKVFMFSYSGTTSDIITSTNNIDNDKKVLITKAKITKVLDKTNIPKDNVISYKTSSNKAKERGFLSFEGTVAPASLFLKLYFKEKNIEQEVETFITNSINYWNSYFSNFFKENKTKLSKILVKSNIINIFTGDFTTSACVDLESKIIESGIFNTVVHEKKNFSHGRFINYEHLSSKINVYFKQKKTTKYEEELINYLNNDNMIIIESLYDDILCEYDLLIASQYLIYYISNFLDIDMSKPSYTQEAMKIYFYKGSL